MITIFTPTYNRKKELNNLYNSLLKQNGNFEWLIVDDGSTDETKSFIDNLIKENKIKIRYIYKENGGKQSAYNLGLKEAKGDIFFCIDSDDILKGNVVLSIEEDFKNLDKNIAGIMYLQGYISNKNKIIGTKFSGNLIDTYFNVYHKYKVTGDKLIVLKTEIAKQYPFPIIENEKFIPEALIYNRISLKYKFVCQNKVVSFKEYLEGGYSANYFNLVKKNPKGNALYYLEIYNLEPTFYNVYGYLLFSFFGKEKFKQIIKHPSKIKIVLLYLPVLLISKIRSRK